MSSSQYSDGGGCGCLLFIIAIIAAIGSITPAPVLWTMAIIGILWAIVEVAA